MEKWTNSRFLHKLIFENRSFKRTVFSLAVIVVFVTTYLLILPAFTLSQKQASEQGGIDVPSAELNVDGVDDTSSDNDSAKTSPDADANNDIDSEDTIKTDKGSSDSGAAEAEEPKPVSEEAAPGSAAEEDKSAASDAVEPSAVAEGNGGSSGLVFEGKGYTVEIDDSNSCLPAGTELKVTEIIKDRNSDDYDDYKELFKKADEAVKKEGSSKTEITFARFYDISFICSGEEIKPDESVKVRITYDKALQKEMKISDEKEVSVIHFAEDEKTGDTAPEMLDSDDIEVTISDDKMTEASFDADSFSIYAVVGTTIEDNVLTSDGHNYHITVNCGADSGIPEGAELEIKEILPADNGDSSAAQDDESESSVYGKSYEDYVADTENALGMKEGSAEYIRLFDIKIVDKDDHSVKYQPKEGTAVDVRIELADAQAAKDLKVVHFADGADEGDPVESSADDAEEGSAVEFPAGSFSVYSIVDAPEPVSFEPYDLNSVDEIEEGKAYLLSYGSPKKYFTSALNNNNCLIENTDSYSAAEWYFEKVTGEENTYCIYTLVGGVKKYIHQKSGNNIELADAGTPINLSGADSNRFYFKHSSQNLWLQHSNGGGGIRFYTDANNLTNAGIYITDAASTIPVDDPYGLDGKSFGIAYHDESVTAAAVTAEAVSSGQRLGGTDLTIRPDVLDNEGYLLVSGDSDITEWTFESVQEDKYYITSNVDGVKKYLTFDSGKVYLSDTPDQVKSVIMARPGTGAYAGKWHFVVGNYALNLPGGSTAGFNAVTGSGKTTWMNLVEKSVLPEEDFTTYDARKVSVSDTENVKDDKQVVIYTRIWNDTTKRYEFYAVDHDGSLIRCYDTGDGIEWVGTKVNTALWTFTEGKNADDTPSYYYWLQNTQYGNYLVPQAASGDVSYETSESQDFNASVNLNGRRYGENFTTIIAWDDEQYSYAGLKTENGHVVPCPLSEAEDFYFAVIDPVDPQAELSTVDTLDNNQYGITMKMVDYNNIKSGTAYSPRDTVQNPFFGGDNNRAGLLSTDLSDGYPNATEATGNNGHSLSELYTGAETVNHLFIESIHNESGYFEYDSTSNFAHLEENNNFTVYNQIGTIGDYNTKTGTHGQFMPYDEMTPGKYAPFTNQTDVLGNELSDLDSRKGEKLYDIGNRTDVDYHFGMELSASFTQTPSGLDAWGHDIIFEFSGDDDFWLYVDGELVLDLGGVHSAMAGNVNFRTGQVKSGRNVSVYRNGGFINTGTYTLRERFEANYRSRNPEATNDEVAEYLNEYFEDGGTVFKDFTNHDMKIFYMERGAGASNLHMRFNLAAVKPGTFMLSKKLSGTELQDSSLIEFPYQIYYHTTKDGESAWHLLGEEDGEKDMVIYEGSTRTLNSAGAYKESFTPAQGTKAYDHVFFLKPGETAEVTLPEGATDYYVVECGVNPDIYDEVRANNTLLQGEATNNIVNDTAREDYSTTEDSLEHRPSVEFDNHVSDDAMRTLSITKKLYDEGGTTELNYPDNDTTFTFRLYLGDENASADSLQLANLYPYCIKDTEGQYCRWDAGAQEFVSLEGITTYDALQQYFIDHSYTDAQKESVIFKTSMNGSISRIPAGYTVEVRNLVISTQYKVEERDYEIPKGYTRREADGYTRVDTDPDVSQRAPYTGTIMSGEDPEIQVRNQKGWGLTAQKVWTDKDFMSSHDDIYFAVYVGDDYAQIPGHTEEQYDEETGETIYTTEYKDCVRVLKSPETELYFFFGDLYNGTPGTAHSFDEYVLREVTLEAREEGTEIELDDEGYVTNLDEFAVTKLEADDHLIIGGTPYGGSHQTGFDYTVSYEVGESTGKNENIRTDIVTNSRPGIKLYKSDWTGSWDDGTLSGALAGAKFTLKDSDGNDVAAAYYTSRSDGLITIAYLNAGTYTLTEIETPSGYVRLDSPITITMDEEGEVSVSGVDGSYYILDTTTDPNMSAVITIRNRTTELQAKKVDAKDTSKVLEGVHFALYRQVTDTEGNPRKDYIPMAGYDDLVTDENGIIPDITMDLAAGTYYLTETRTQSGYALLSEDVCFTIGVDGTFTLNNGADTGSSSSRTEDTMNGKISYVLTIPNYKIGVKLKKVDDKSNALTGAKFNLCKLNDQLEWENVPGYEVIDMTSSSVTSLSDLTDGRYKLTELAAPAGYIILDKSVYFRIENGKVELTDEAGDDLTESTKASVSTETDQNKDTIYVITVSNTPGVELPASGGMGTHWIYLIGSILVLASGIALVSRRRIT